MRWTGLLLAATMAVGPVAYHREDFIYLQEVSADELEDLFRSASAADPPQTILEFFLSLSNSLQAEQTRLVIRGQVWRELLDRKVCTLGSYQGRDMAEFFPLRALNEIQFGAVLAESEFLGDPWVAWLDPNHPDVVGGVIKTRIGSYKAEVGRSRREERPRGTFGAAAHRYDAVQRSGEYRGTFGIVAKKLWIEAWLTGIRIENARKITVFSSSGAVPKFDVSELTSIACR